MPRDHGEAAHDPALAGGGQRVLVVHVRPAGADDDVALPQVVEADGVDAGDGVAVVLVHPECAKRIHDESSEFSCQIAARRQRASYIMRPCRA